MAPSQRRHSSRRRSACRSSCPHTPRTLPARAACDLNTVSGMLVGWLLNIAGQEEATCTWIAKGKECRRTMRGGQRAAAEGLLLFVGSLTSKHASVSQGLICSDKLTPWHTEIEVADQAFYFTQSQYSDTGPTSPSADPISPGAWQGSHWSDNFSITGMTRPRKKKTRRKRDSNPGSSALEADADDRGRQRQAQRESSRYTERLTHRHTDR